MAVRDRIMDTAHWATGFVAMNRYYQAVPVNDRSATKWCVLGSLALELGTSDVSHIRLQEDPAGRFLYAAAKGCDWGAMASGPMRMPIDPSTVTLPHTVNDICGHAATMEMLDVAIRLAKEAEEDVSS
jgi:hypothetical protein